MIDEIVLWNGELKLRVSKINAIRIVCSHKAYVYVEGVEKRFLCEDYKDVELLKAVKFELDEPTTQGHSWETDVEKILDRLEEGMPVQAYHGGYDASYTPEIVVRPWLSDEELAVYMPWMVPRRHV